MKLFLSCLVAAAVVAAPVPAAAGACLDAEALEALRVRELQTMMMVSALRCREAEPGIAAAYNRFVARARDRLVEGERRLISHFDRAGGRAAYDRFTAALANRHSEAAGEAGNCAIVARLLAADEASGGALAELVARLQMVPQGAGEACPAGARSGVAVASPFDPIPE